MERWRGINKNPIVASVSSMIINVFNDIPEILRDFRAIHVDFSRNLAKCKPLFEIFRETSPNPHI